MKVILSTDAIKHPMTGIGRYTLQLARHLAQRQEIKELLFSHGRTLLRHVPEPLHQPASISRLRDHFSRYDLLLDGFRKARSHLKARSIRQRSAHVYHGTNYYLPEFSGKRVVTSTTSRFFLFLNATAPTG